MSTRKRPRTRAAVLRAFDRAAQRGLDLRWEPGAPQSRMMGILLAPAAHSTPAADRARMPAAATRRSNAAIKRVVSGWAALHHADLLRKWKSYLTSPYLAVGPGWVRSVDAAYLRGWLKSRQFAQLEQQFKPFRRRRVTVSDLDVTYIGRDVAGATFREREVGADGKIALGTAAALLVRQRAGWRIAAVAKHSRFA